MVLGILLGYVASSVVYITDIHRLYFTNITSQVQVLSTKSLQKELFLANKVFLDTVTLFLRMLRLFIK